MASKILSIAVSTIQLAGAFTGETTNCALAADAALFVERHAA
jgi:hypothetical protein